MDPGRKNANVCLICLSPTDGTYHGACLQPLFGHAQLPEIDVDLAELHTLALAMVGHTSISGVQRKISTRLSVDRKTLQVAASGGRYLLKPASDVYPNLPENELVTMRLAALAGVEIPPCGLLPLKDGSLAYVIRRFDRLEDGRKLAQEDFCQLAEYPPRDKYRGSAELLVRLVKRYASEPLIDLAQLFRLLVVVWWTGNGDMHLKNFSLLTDAGGLVHLSPAYDLVATRLLIPDDQLALPVGGRRDGLVRRDFLELAAYAGIPVRAAERALQAVVDACEPALELIARSPLAADRRAAYQDLVRTRTATLR